MKHINLPNRLTILRILLIVPFVILASVDRTWCRYVALAVFCIASVTDHLDGRIARSRGLVTDFGKFADPIADKMLVMSAFTVFVGRGWMPAWVCIVFMSREFIVSGFRLVAAGKGQVIAAGILGKIKTTAQMLAAVLMLLFTDHFIVQIVMYIALVMTVWSGADYLWKNRSLIRDM